MSVKLRLFRTSPKKIGLSPGTIEYVGETRQDEKIRLNLTRYDSENFSEEEILVDKLDSIPVYAGIKWLDVTGIHNPQIIEKIGKIFEIHSLVLEDIANTTQQPKIEDYEDLIYVVLKMFYVDSNNEIKMEHLSFVLKERVLISFQEIRGDVFDPVRKRLHEGRKKLRGGPSDYLLYALMDAIIDNYYHVINQIGEKIDLLKKAITYNANKNNLLELDKLYDEILVMQNSFGPLNTIIPELQEYDTKLFHEENHVYFRDLQDHITQTSATILTVKDKLSSMNDYYLAVVSNRTNEVMKTLALVATICVPITVIAGIYGMNFQHMPELSSPYAYPIVLSAMATIGGLLYGYFKKKKWV